MAAKTNPGRSKWEILPLGELIENFDGRRVPVKEMDRKPGPHPYYGASGVVDYVDDYLFDGDYLLIAEDGENLRTRQTPIAFMATGKFWVNNHAHIVRGNHRADTRFLGYVLSQTDISGYLTGSTMPKLTQGNLNRLPIVAPPLPEQKAIASILGALDDKIELNRRMNATLEAMARALFQSWFVDFDPVRAKLDGREPEGMDSDTAALFPGTFEDSTLGPIPHGWRPAHVEEIASIRTGKRPQGRCDIVSPECNIPLYGGGGRMGYVSFALYDKPILFTGRVGTLGLIFRTAEPSWPSDNTLIVEPHAGHFDFTYFVLKGLDLITLNRGSTQPLVTQTDLKRLMFVLPTKRVFQAFADVSVPIFQQIVSKERESRTLAALRDTLLPKLLCGEMSVVAAEEVAHNPDSHPL